MARYSILITHPPSDFSQTIAVQRFAAQLDASGHSVSNMFFYGDGTYHANATVQIPSDEYQSYAKWEEIKHATDCALLVCITAAIKRGILGQNEAEEAGVCAVTLDGPFEQVGLGEFFTQLHDCDHLVQF